MTNYTIVIIFTSEGEELVYKTKDKQVQSLNLNGMELGLSITF